MMHVGCMRQCCSSLRMSVNSSCRAQQHALWRSTPVPKSQAHGASEATAMLSQMSLRN